MMLTNHDGSKKGYCINLVKYIDKYSNRESLLGIVVYGLDCVSLVNIFKLWAPLVV